LPSQKRTTGKQREDQEQEVVELNFEREIDIVGEPLEESIWAPSKRNCNQNNSLLANISAYNVLENTKEERIKFIRWSLRNNIHVKDVKETFKRGNLWVEVDFDCEYGRNDAIQRISKKESDWYRMIPEEKGNTIKRQTQYAEKSQRRDSSKSRIKEEEVKRKGNKSKTNENQHEANEELENTSYITIWDLPTGINKRELEYICRRFRKVHIVRIKKSKYKALAVVKIERTYEDIPWAIPVNNNKLVRVTKGIEDHEAKEGQRKYVAKLTELPGSTSEVLLLRSLRSKGAK
jgi:hypothetical protein